MLCGPWSPDQAIEPFGQNSWSISGQHLPNLGVALEQSIPTIVVMVSICTESEENLYDRFSPLQCVTFNGPGKRRNALVANLDSYWEDFVQRTQ